MPASASMLRRLSARFSRLRQYDISDALAISATCAERHDIFGRETWLDLAVERMVRRGLPIPQSIRSTDIQDLAA